MSLRVEECADRNESYACYIKQNYLKRPSLVIKYTLLAVVLNGIKVQIQGHHIMLLIRSARIIDRHYDRPCSHRFSKYCPYQFWKLSILHVITFFFLLNEKCYLFIACINIQAFEGHEGDYLLSRSPGGHKTIVITMFQCSYL